MIGDRVLANQNKVPIKQPTAQERQAEKANIRIAYYLAGGARPVYISRWVVSAIVIVFSLAIWWHKIG